MTPKPSRIEPKSFAVHPEHFERSEAGSTDPRRARAERVGSVLLWIWLPSTLIVISLLMAGHLLTLPKPILDPKQVKALQASVFTKTQTPTWSVFHVLAEKCGCSAKVADHLVERGAKSLYAERVLWIGHDTGIGTRLAGRGFALETISAGQLKAKYGIEGAPLMVVVKREGRVTYSGGYSRWKQGVPEDDQILANLAAGGSAAALPLFGCAISRELQKKLDPLGLKYAKNEAEP